MASNKHHQWLSVARSPTYVHGQYTAGDEFTVLSDAEVPRLYPHHVVKHELQVQAALYAHLHRFRALIQTKEEDKVSEDGYAAWQRLPAYLREHGLSVLSDHSALVTVERNKVIVEGFLGMFKYVVELRGSALKYTPEVPWN